MLDVFKPAKIYVIKPPVSKINYYRKGQSVRLTERGVKSFSGVNSFFNGEWSNREGIVVRPNRGITVYIKWQGNTSISRIHYSFLQCTN